MFRFTILALLINCFSSTSIAAIKPLLPPGKNITIVVNANGTVQMGRDTLKIDLLATEIQARLWKSYIGTGRMYDSIKLYFEGEVLMGTRSAAMDAIKSGQAKALTEICLEKHKKRFDDLNNSQQNKIKKQFPVLFQTTYQ